MKKGTAAALIFAGLALILDSRCAAEAAREALSLCARTLIPGLFPLLVVAGMLVPGLSGLRMETLSRLLGLPRGGEGIWLLGLLGGFPVGAAAISQGSETALWTKGMARGCWGCAVSAARPSCSESCPNFCPWSRW